MVPALAAWARPAQSLWHFSGLARSPLEAAVGAGGYHRAGQAGQAVLALGARLLQVSVEQQAVDPVLHLRWRWRWRWQRHCCFGQLAGRCPGPVVRLWKGWAVELPLELAAAPPLEPVEEMHWANLAGHWTAPAHWQVLQPRR